MKDVVTRHVCGETFMCWELSLDGTADEQWRLLKAAKDLVKDADTGCVFLHGIYMDGDDHFVLDVILSFI